jgi:hypothetical protein
MVVHSIDTRLHEYSSLYGFIPKSLRPCRFLLIQVPCEDRMAFQYVIRFERSGMWRVASIRRRYGCVRSQGGEEIQAKNMKRKKKQLFQLSKARLDEMIEQATVDAYDESEQAVGWLTMIGENLGVPFETTVLGVPATVERVDLNQSDEIVAVCTRGHSRQSLPIVDIPLPSPPPQGSEWIAAYRRWRGEG